MLGLLVHAGFAPHADTPQSGPGRYSTRGCTEASQQDSSLVTMHERVSVRVTDRSLERNLDRGEEFGSETLAPTLRTTDKPPRRPWRIAGKSAVPSTAVPDFPQ